MAEEEIIVKVDAGLKELIPGYLDNRRRDLDAIENALEALDFDNLETIGHNMKGTGNGYGFAEISAIGDILESNARAGNGEAVAECLVKLRRYLARLRVVYGRE